jgi:hypothetical protein
MYKTKQSLNILFKSVFFFQTLLEQQMHFLWATLFDIKHDLLQVFAYSQ